MSTESTGIPLVDALYTVINQRDALKTENEKLRIRVFRLRSALDESCWYFEPDNLTMQTKLEQWKRIAKAEGTL